MLTIQEVGLSVFSQSPKNLYIFGGPEYGIKDEYIAILSHTVGEIEEYPSVSDFIALMSRYHIIPLQPKVYVVRYDRAFISSLNKDVASKLLSLDTIGTLVLIYEDDKDLNKLDKQFPDNTAYIDYIGAQHQSKHLRKDFPNLDGRTIGVVTKYSPNYYQSKTICRCLNAIQDKIVLSEGQILSLFDLQSGLVEDAIQVAVASRSFGQLMRATESYDGDVQNILYQILRTMIELDKCQNSKYSNSPLRKYANNWSRVDIYYMYNHTYNAIQNLRAGVTADVEDLIIWLGALMKFKTIPSVGML